MLLVMWARGVKEAGGPGELRRRFEEAGDVLGIGG